MVFCCLFGLRHEGHKGGIPMKKRWKILLLGTVCLFAMAGCGASESGEIITEDTAAEYVEKAQDMLEEANGFAADFCAEVQVAGAGGTKTEGSVTLAKEPLFMHVDTTLSFDKLKQEYDLYLEKTEDAVNQYMSYDGEWTEMTMDEASALAGAQIYNTLYNMETILTAAENWSAEKTGNDIVLTGSIPEAKFYDVESYTRWFQLAGMSGLAEVYYVGVGDVPVEVFLDGRTGAPKGYAVSLEQALETMTNNVLTELGGGSLREPVEVETYSIVSELTQLGDVEAGEIPAEAKNDAINYEKEYSSMDKQ